MDADLFEAKGLRPRDPRRARIEGYGLRIGERATLVPADDGRPLTVACYLLPKELAGGEVNRQYAAELAELAHRLGLPAEYVAEIERLRG